MGIRVLHTPADVGGHPAGLAAAERALGLESTVVTLDEPPFGYAVDRVLAPAGTSTPLREWRRWTTAWRARTAVDVIHFNFGSTLAPAYHGPDARHGLGGSLFDLYARTTEQLDLRVLRRAGVAIFVTFQGDDVRPSGDPGANASKRRRVEGLAGTTDGMYVLNPDLLAHVPAAAFLPYANVDPRVWTPVAPSGDGPLRVVHAPSDRVRKGTAALVGAVERLRCDGVAIELELVEGRPWAEARAAYERADVVVDQLLVGWYGGVAVEAMALAKPVVAHLDPHDLGRVPPEMREQLPIVAADRSSVEAALRDLATTSRAGLAELGARGRTYVERWHDPLKIAERVVADYERALAARRRDA